MTRIAIRAAALFDGSALVPDPLVLVADGRLAEVAFGPRAAAPPDVELVELPGATLLPGLVDTHVHLAFDASTDPSAPSSRRTTTSCSRRWSAQRRPSCGPASRPCATSATAATSR